MAIEWNGGPGILREGLQYRPEAAAGPETAFQPAGYYDPSNQYFTRDEAFRRPTYSELQTENYGDIGDPSGRFWSQFDPYTRNYVSDPSRLVEQASGYVNWSGYPEMLSALGPQYAQQVQGAQEAAARNNAPDFLDKAGDMVGPALAALFFGPGGMVSSAGGYAALPSLSSLFSGGQANAFAAAMENVGLGEAAGLPTTMGSFGGSMGGLTSLAANIAPGEMGGIPQEILKRLGINMGGPWSTGFSLLSGLYGMGQAGKIQRAASAPPQVIDPFGYGIRAPYAAELAALRADPSRVTQTPGYQAGLDAVTRKMASQGYLGSGNMMAALSEYGGQFYDRELARLAGLAGAQFQPMAFRNDTSGLAAGADLASKALASMGYAVRGMEQPGGILSRG